MSWDKEARFTVNIKRKLYAKLLHWKERSQGKSALLIEGARRVGKTYLAREFAKQEYRSFLYIDFSRPNEIVRKIFLESSSDLDVFFGELSLIFGTELFPRESCLVFDEVQLFPEARQLVKHIVADGRYDVIETGSLIGIRHNVKDILIPSEEEHVELCPLDLEEFMWALGKSRLYDFLAECFEKRKPIGEPLHREMIKLVRLYVLLGGMPQVVCSYAENKDLLAARQIQKNILTLYRDDIGKYAGGYDLKVRSIFDGIPSALSSHEKRFKLASLEKNARMREYEEAFLWLSDSKIVNLCFNAEEPAFALEMSRDRTWLKCYLADTGLLVALATEGGIDVAKEILQAILYKKLNINEGMFFENLVAQMLRAKGHKLFFYAKPHPEYAMRKVEIDFLIRGGKKIMPIEAKSSVIRSHWSLDVFGEKFKKILSKPVVICTKELAEKEGILYLPIYMTPFL